MLMGAATPRIARHRTSRLNAFKHYSLRMTRQTPAGRCHSMNVDIESYICEIFL